MQGWVQTLDGRNVYEQGDGWLWFPREQAWRYEPRLLTMAKAPASEQISAEFERLSTDWPTLKQAWRWESPWSGSKVFVALRLFVCGVAVYQLLHVVPLVKGLRADIIGMVHDSASHATDYQEGVIAACSGLGILATLAVFMIWLNHVWLKDPHKGLLVSGTIRLWAVHREHERRERHRYGGHR